MKGGERVGMMGERGWGKRRVGKGVMEVMGGRGGEMGGKMGMRRREVYSMEAKIRMGRW